MSRRTSLIVIATVSLLASSAGEAWAQKAGGARPKWGKGAPPGVTGVAVPKGPTKAASVVLVPEDAALPPAGNSIRLTKLTNPDFFSCFAVPVLTYPAAGYLELFSRTFTTSESSSYVGLVLNTEPFLVPFSSDGVGIAYSITIEQDTTVPPDGVFDTVAYPSGLVADFFPWFAFVPLPSYNTSSFSASYEGWAPVQPNTKTKVTVTSIGQSWGTETSYAYNCNSNLKITY